MSALTHMSMPPDLKQLGFLLGGLSNDRKFLNVTSKRIRPITPLLTKGIQFSFTASMGLTVRELVAKLSDPPVLVSPDLDAVADGHRHIRVYCDTRIMFFVLRLRRSKPTAPSDPSPTPAALASSQRDTGPRLI